MAEPAGGEAARNKTSVECLANRIMALRDARCEPHHHYLCDVCAGQWIAAHTEAAVKGIRQLAREEMDLLRDKNDALTARLAQYQCESADENNCTKHPGAILAYGCSHCHVEDRNDLTARLAAAEQDRDRLKRIEARLGNKRWFIGIVRGTLKRTIIEHGPITPANQISAEKRLVGSILGEVLKSDSNIPACEEELARHLKDFEAEIADFEAEITEAHRLIDTLTAAVAQANQERDDLQAWIDRAERKGAIDANMLSAPDDLTPPPGGRI